METAKREIHKQQLDRIPTGSSDSAPEDNSESTAGSYGPRTGSGEGSRSTSGDSQHKVGEPDASTSDADAVDEDLEVSNDESRGGRSNDTEPYSGNELDDISSKPNDPSRWRDDEAPPLSLNYDAIKHMATYYLPGDHGACVDITEMLRGGYHEIQLLHFADGWSCIARFTREEPTLDMFESQLATMEYVRQHTNVPVPRILLTQPNYNHVAGAAFVLMERMEGEKLEIIWDDLSIMHKLDVLDQIADVIAELATLEFDRIGCLKSDGMLGPILYTERVVDRVHDQPYTNTADYMCAFLRADDSTKSEEARSYYPEIEADLRTFLQNESTNPIYNAPYRLIHNDFEPRNMLFSHPDPVSAPQLTAIIDWDYAYTGPLYCLCEYPLLIQDEDYHPERFYENKCMRKSFVKAILSNFPKDSAIREDVRRCFREKNTRMNRFKSVFMECSWTLPWVEAEKVKGHLADVEGGNDEWKVPYGAVEKWELDSEVSESEDNDDEDEDEDGRVSDGGSEDGDASQVSE